MVIKQIQNKGETYYSVCIDYKIFIIQEKYYDSFLTTLKNNFPISENPRIVDLSNNIKYRYSHPFFQNTSFNPHQFSHIHTEIANFSKSLELQDIEIWSFIEEVLIGFIICKGYEHSNDSDKQASKGKHKIFNESDLIFLRSLKSNGHSNDISQTDLYYYFKDQSIYVIKTWNNNNQESLKKYEKERAVFELFQESELFLDFPQYFGQAIFSQSKPNIVIEYLQGQNLYDILNKPNQREFLSKEKKLNIILSIMYSIETLHFHGLVYRDLKFDNVIVLPNHEAFNCARLVDFDACCKLPSKKCEPIDEHPKYFFKEEIDYANNIITVLKIDRETNTETFVKTISLNDNFNISLPEDIKLEMSIETYDLTNDIGSNYFSSPEQRTSNKYTYASDIYSLGKFMYYLCIGEIPSEQTEKHIKFPLEYSFLERLYNLCTRENPSERPNISIVLNKFFKLISRLSNHQQPNLNSEYEINFTHFYCFRFSNFHIFVDTLNILTYDNYVLNMVYPILYFLHFPFLDRKNSHTLQYDAPLLSKLLLLSEYYHFERNVLNGRSLGILGRLLCKGILFPPNEILGRTYLMEGALLNDSFSQFYFGLFFLDKTFHCKKHALNIATNFLEKAANTGSPKHINSLALLYLENPSLPDAISHGIELLKMTADQYNNSDAQAILGCWFYQQQDLSQSIYYLERSSVPVSKLALGKIYLESYPDSSDKVLGYYYLKLASDQGVNEAHLYISYICLWYKLPTIALKYLTLASKTDSRTSFLLFCLYTAGIFPQRGFEKSLEYLQSSIKQGYPTALMIYAQLTENSGNHCPDLNKYIKSIPSGRQSLTYFVDIINSSENLSDDEYEDDFLSVLYEWYLFTFDYDCDIREFLDFQNLLMSLGQSQIVLNFFMAALYNCQNGNMKALTFINDYSNFNEAQLVTKDLLEMVQPFADNNNGAAQWFLASKLLFCREFCDTPKGIHYLKAAAKNNNERALYTLGCLYFGGEMSEFGIPRNTPLGFKLVKRSAEKGLISARADVSPLLVKTDFHLAFSYAKEAISKGEIDGYFALGLCYFQMMNYPGDSFCQKAIECINKVEKLGNPTCKAMLAMVYSDGILASKDEERSFRLYTELVNTTSEMHYIHNNLGVILKNGNQFVSKNIPLAIEYFETAIKNYNDIFALFNLSRMYFYGEGVPKNVDKATALLSQLKTSQFDISTLLDYIQRHPMISTEIFNATSDNDDMNQILPISYRHLFPPKCFNSIDFVYGIDSWDLMRISPNVLIQKQLKSEIVTNYFYEGLL